MACLSLTPASEPVVRTKTKQITADMIKQTSFQTLIDDMIQTMYEKNGIGLAATQIGQPFSLATLVPDPDRFDFYEKGSRDAIVIINPRIIHRSIRGKSTEEGCLSVPGYMGLVKRKNDVTVVYTDRQGNEQTAKASGLLARVYQHEIDHLNGILFIDHADTLFKIHAV